MTGRYRQVVPTDHDRNACAKRRERAAAQGLLHHCAACGTPYPHAPGIDTLGCCSSVCRERELARRGRQ